MIYKLKQRLITKTRKCIQYVIIISFLVMFLGYIYGSLSFICISFMFPVIAVLFFFHYNAYDTTTGTLDYRSFDNYIKNLNKPFGIMCLYLKDFHIENNKNLAENFIVYTEKIFKDFCIFRIADSKIFLVYTKKNNLDEEQLLEKVIENFKPLYIEYKIPYKLVHINSDERLDGSEDYTALHSLINKNMELNSLTICNDEHIQNFIKAKNVGRVLCDICEKNDLNDPRVLVYCQPIYNVKTGTYTNIEVLMRIKMDNEIIMPDIFIPVAESNGYMYTLSKIIINKVCNEINLLVQEDYIFDKISINVSTSDFKYKDMYKEISELINSSDVIKNKISFEITESKDGEYENINEVISKFKKDGIIFYLDDFGTSYSNLQRAFSLEIDVIKLDRSIIKLVHKSKRDYLLIKKLVEMLKNADYVIVFEGIETLEDETVCIDMKADYLQGYRYSKPIEISQIRNFLQKSNAKKLVGLSDMKKRSLIVNNC
jgi:EAL domain-containing protein (putative c-di-GMP-specific phosphodiesterase class I)